VNSGSLDGNGAALTSQTRQIILREACIGMVVGGLLSLAIFYATFRNSTWLSLDEFHFDMIPQTLGICFFTALGVSFGARPKAKKGQLPVLEKHAVLPNNIFLRAILLTVAGLLIAAAPVIFAFSSLAPGGASFMTSLIIKLVYGAILSAIIAGLSMRAVMGEPR
jgi:hypothetical protein